MIGIFDRDNDKILQAVNAQTSEFYSFGNKVYGFCIPIPEMRFRNNQTKISIEYLYSDAEIKTVLPNGCRLFSVLNLQNNLCGIIQNLLH